MKKITIFILLFLVLLFSLSALSYGYAVTPFGESIVGDNYGGIKLNALLCFDRARHIGDIEAGVVLGYSNPVFKGLDLGVTFPLYSTTSHIFNNFFSNPVWWIPRLEAGIAWRMNKPFSFFLGLTPLSFADTSFTYDILSPYMVIDVKGDIGWGVVIMKFTAFFGGK